LRESNSAAPESPEEQAAIAAHDTVRRVFQGGPSLPATDARDA
jgi:hypothetical protein